MDQYWKPNHSCPRLNKQEFMFFIFSLHTFEITHFYILFLPKIPEYGGVGGFPSVFRRRWSSVPSFHGLHMSHYSLVVFLYIKKHQYSTCILIFGQWPKSMSVSCPSFHFNFHTLQVFLNSIVNVICCPGYRGSRGGITVVATADFGDGNNENYLEINVN